MRAIDLAVNAILPDDLKDNNRLLDKKGVEQLMSDVASRHPEKYAEIVKGVADLGRNSAWQQGETMTLHDMEPLVDKEAAYRSMDAEIAQAKHMHRKDPEAFRQARLEIWGRHITQLGRAAQTAGLAADNNLYNAVASGARGNATQARSISVSPGLYSDYKDRTIPRFVRNSFAEGLRPADFLASAFGVRKSIISTKSSTAKGGDLLKQMVQATANEIVSEDDCGTANGIVMDPSSADARNRVLARDYGDVKAGAVVDKGIAAELRREKVEKIMVRSPLTCQSRAGLCSQCLGRLPTGHFAPLGYAAGLTAAQALGEPVTQAALSSKHTAGAYKGAKKVFSGFPVLSQLVESPETFPNRAAAAETAGVIDKVETAPQGGHNVWIKGREHYVLPDMAVTVKPGDQVEAGDQLSDGIVDPSDLVRLKGLGSGRKYYVDRLRQAYEESDLGKPTSLNLELLARGSLNHVRVDDPAGTGEYLPDDLASYQSIAHDYSPAKESSLVPVSRAAGQYLEAPALHFTIGTKLTPKMAREIEEAGLTHVQAGHKEPAFHPEMVRLRAAAHSNPDWLARMQGSSIAGNLEESAARSRDTNLESNENWAPRLAVGRGFGEHVSETGKF